MELKDLVGKQILDGVDFETGKIEKWEDHFEDCQVMRFRLNGIVYMVSEDPEDGYRSTMREISISDVPIKNTFAPIEVFGIHRTCGGYSRTDDILELYGMDGRTLIIEVGTENTDDYYPCFVANFNPPELQTD